MKETNDQTKGLMRDCFFVRQGERRERCFYSEILYVEASGCYCYIHRRDKPRLSIAYPLLMLEPFLPVDMFRRVHRSYIVNLCEVDGFIGKAICIGKSVLPVSPPYRAAVFGCFNFWDLGRVKKGREDVRERKFVNHSCGVTLSPLRFVLSVYFFIFVGNNQERNTCMKSTKEYIELLKEFKNKEAGHYAISRIGIFGSVARGEQTEESDVDVYVECPPMGLFRLGSLKNTLEQLFGCRVDIVRLRDHMNAFLRERIEKEGIYV